MPSSLTAKRARELLSYDPATGILRWRSTGRKAGNLEKSTGYVRVRIDGSRQYAHRLAFLVTTGDWPSFNIDHKNLIRDDNRWDNLRQATLSQNGANARLSSANKTGFKGVEWAPHAKRWRARLRFMGRRINLGYFDTPEEAHAAYLEKASEVFGDFARSG